MIEIEKSKTGLPIMKIEGRLINSSYDPMTEAQNWLSGVSGRIRDYQVIFLLGLGSIYHCLALQKSFPNKKIVVLETDAQLIKTSLELLSDLKKLQICQIADASDLLVIPEVMNLTEQIFCTLRLPSTRFSNKGFFDDIETILTGRSSYEFSKFCEKRPDFKNQIDFEKLKSSKLISVREIAEAFAQDESILTRERRVLYILEELIR